MIFRVPMKLNMTYYGNDIKINNYDKIIENLFIGNKESVKEFHRFDLLVNCTREINYSMPCIKIPVDDSPSEYLKMLTFIYDTGVLEKMHSLISQNKPVLVHCYAGMQRSCAVVACYLVKYHGMTPENAILFIRQRRPVAFYYQVNFLRTIMAVYDSTLEKDPPKL